MSLLNRKKLKFLVVSAVATFGLTSIAFAVDFKREVFPAIASSDVGVYLGINSGWGFTHWKNLSER